MTEVNKRKRKQNYNQAKHDKRCDGNSEEEKILNIEQINFTDVNPRTSEENFYVHADLFEAALKMLQIHENSENVCKRLHVIKNKISQKISGLQNCAKMKFGSLDNLSKTFGESTLSLCSEKSTKVSSKGNPGRKAGDSALADLFKVVATSTQAKHLDDNKKFQKFNTEVSCPFCLKSEDDKNSLIKHLDKSCVAFMNKEFVESVQNPYSVFQILPKNAFKCNLCPNSLQYDLRQYYLHTQSNNHIQSYLKAKSHKTYTDSLFCSCCKIQVPNNATEISFHIKHRAHKSRSDNQPPSWELTNLGIHCVYLEKKKFKCLICPSQQSVHKKVIEILKHLESKIHLSHAKNKGLRMIYCFVCSSKIAIYDIIGHFISKEHLAKEEETKKAFQLCFYCGFECENLVKLASHMQSDCKTITDIRGEGCTRKLEQREDEENGRAEDEVEREEDEEKGRAEDEEKGRAEDEVEREEEEEDDGVINRGPEKEKKTEGYTSHEKRHFIIVKGYTDPRGLFNFFRKFGEISEIDQCEEEDFTKITFEKEKAVQDILPLREMVKINGVKLTITVDETAENRCPETDEKLEETESSRKPSNAGIEPAAGKKKSDSGTDEENKNSRLLEEFSKSMKKNGNGKLELGKLLERVSGHLSLNTKADSEEEEDVTLLCEKLLPFGESFQYIGFSKCNLSFPVEDVTLYCEVYANEDFFCVTESKAYTDRLIENSNSLLKTSNFIENITSSLDVSFPYAQFSYSKTGKNYKISFRKSEKLLTDMLSDCLSQCEFSRPFVLIVRFWLSVHSLQIKEFEFVVISLLIFFLISKNYACLGEAQYREMESYKVLKMNLIEPECKSESFADGRGGSNKKLPKDAAVSEMFEGFLKFLDEFNFEDNWICLPFKNPFPKTLLSEEPIRSLTRELKEILRSPVCIMDPFVYNNLASDLTRDDIQSLLKVVRDTVEYYDIS